MSDPVFFPRAGVVTLADIVALTRAVAPEGADLSRVLTGVGPLDRAGPSELTFLDNPKYAAEAGKTQAAACLVSPRHAARLPAATLALVTPHPYHAFAAAVARLFPTAMRPQSIFGATGVSPGTSIHPTAKLEDGVTVDPGAVIGPGAEIGGGTLVGAGSVIGPNVRIGRDCAVAANCTITHALVGNRVIVHPGVAIGQDGFGFAMSPRGHLKVPQVGRVVIQDDVEIGANTCIDRGANRDTVIGEGTKIDNLVQIGHNVTIGRHCVIVAQVGIAGSTSLGDFVVIGGAASIAGHLTIGMGAQLAATAGLMNDMPPGGKWAGAPAKPGRTFFREVSALAKLAAKGRAQGVAKGGPAGEDGS